MLAGLCHHLARAGRTVLVVARGARRLATMADRVPTDAGAIVPIRVDYGKSRELAACLAAAFQEHGVPDLVVCWTHSSSPAAPRVVAEQVDRAGRRARLFHVLPHDAGDPDAVRRRRHGFERFEKIAYRQVLLGARSERGRARWLTHAEIVAGVLRAMDRDADLHVAGRLDVEP